jgi:hypothetical protein
MNGEVKSKHGAAGLHVSQNETPKLSKSAAPIGILRLFSQPINLRRNVASSRRQESKTINDVRPRNVIAKLTLN